MGRSGSQVSCHSSLSRLGLEVPLGEEKLRPVIAASWRRSAACGVGNQKEPKLPYLPEFDRECCLMRAARPILERLMVTLGGTATSVILADREGRILERWVGDSALNRALDKANAASGFVFAEEFAGTNGLGTTLEESSAVSVRGEEHFADYLKHLACVGVPIHHPIHGTVEGVLDITCLAREHDPLMAPLLVEAVRHIETQLAQLSSPEEMALLEEFLGTCRRYPGAVVGLNPALNLTNSAAAERLVPFDHPVLWEFARDLTTSGRTEGVVELAQGSCKVHCLPVANGRCGPSAVVMRLDFASPKGEETTTAVHKAHVPLATHPLPGRSPQWRQVMSTVFNLADLREPVAIIGEAGVGKVHLARYLHEISAHDHPCSQLVVYDLSSLDSASLTALLDALERASECGDTFVLRHVDSLSPAAMAEMRSILTKARGPRGARRGRVLATAVTSADATEEDELLSVCFPLQVRIPPLRQRSEDIADLVPALLAGNEEHKNARCSIRALHTLMRYQWPGNIAELKEALMIALRSSRGHDIEPEHLPSWILKRSASDRLSALERAERNAIIEVLASVGNSRTEAAKVLGIGRATLYRKLRSLGIPTNREMSF